MDLQSSSGEEEGKNILENENTYLKSATASVQSCLPLQALPNATIKPTVVGRAIVASTINIKPMCKYGASCYRVSNPTHVLEFQHPHLVASSTTVMPTSRVSSNPSINIANTHVILTKSPVNASLMSNLNIVVSSSLHCSFAAELVAMAKAMGATYVVSFSIDTANHPLSFCCVPFVFISPKQS